MHKYQLIPTGGGVLGLGTWHFAQPGVACNGAGHHRLPGDRAHPREHHSRGGYRYGGQ